MGKPLISTFPFLLSIGLIDFYFERASIEASNDAILD
jgi:hypothetical protein